jgi:hypothetical protein
MAILRHSSSSYYYYYYLSGANRRWVLLGRDLARQPLLRGGSIVVLNVEWSGYYALQFHCAGLLATSLLAY